MGVWNTTKFYQNDHIFLFVYVVGFMLYYFYFFWPFQISIVIDSMQQVISTDGYPDDMDSLTMREIVGTRWLLNYKPWASLYG